MSLRVRLTLAVALAAGVLLGFAAWAVGIVVEETIIDRAISTELVAFEDELLSVDNALKDGLIADEADLVSSLARQLESSGDLQRVWELFGVAERTESGGGLVVLSDLSVLRVLPTGQITTEFPPSAPGIGSPDGVFIDDFAEAAFDVISNVTPVAEPQIFITAESAPDGSINILRGAPADPVQVETDARIFGNRPELPLAIDIAPGRVVLNSPIVANATDTADLVRLVMIVTAAALTAAIAASAWILTGRALQPVDAIIGRVDDITGGTLHERVPEPGSGDEIDRLARTMNAMLERLEHNDTRRRQFVSDASHELRSPVASIRTELEVAMRYPEAADWPEVAENVQAENLRLETVIADLLALARLDEQAAPLSLEDVDLDEIVFAESAHSRSVAIDTSAVSAGRVRGRAEDLATVVRHLLDNAARHAASQVALTLTSTGEAVHLIVDDDGTGIPVEERAKVFARFARLQEARDRDTGGAGLGLAVVRGLVQRHGGVVTISDAPLGGARMHVCLPTPPHQHL